MRYRRQILEGFVVLNFAILALDVALAHSVNRFREWEEWLPFVFSVLAPMLIVLELYLNSRAVGRREQRIRLVVGGLAIAMGIAGMIYHLESQFFVQHTLHSLVYTAPFIAPLAYTGLGFLLLLNRMVPDSSREWSVWVILMALGGFGGNFVLTLADHAQNGFFHLMEWLPVVSSAFIVGFLTAAVLPNADRRFLNLCLQLLVLQAAIGILGFFLHVAPSFSTPSEIWLQTLIHGPPALAPLLFPNLAILAALGVLM